MKPKTMILMAVAIVCGLGASYMTSRLLAEREEQQVEPTPEPERVKFLVAKSNLDHGAAIKNPQEMFVEKTSLKDDAPKDFVIEMKILKGKFLKRALRKGDHITPEDLMDEKTSILANLPDGYQAYGIQVDSASIAGGWASLPGSKVNIIWTMRGMNKKDSFSKLLLEDVTVLAADGHSARLEDGKAMPASVVTVALKTTDTMKVKLAQSFGPLTLTLRRYGDITPSPDEGKFTGVDLFDGNPTTRSGFRGSQGGIGNSEGSGADYIVPVLPSNQGKKQDVATLPGTKKDQTTSNDPKKNVPTPPDTKQDVPALPDLNKEEPAPKRYYHVFTVRQGDKQSRQVIEVDANGAPIQDDVQRDSQEQVPPAPAVQSQPAPQQRPQPAGSKK